MCLGSSAFVQATHVFLESNGSPIQTFSLLSVHCLLELQTTQHSSISCLHLPNLPNLMEHDIGQPKACVATTLNPTKGMLNICVCIDIYVYRVCMYVCACLNLSSKQKYYKQNNKLQGPGCKGEYLL